MNEGEKDVLLKLVARIEHLQASQDLLAALVGKGVSLTAAAEGMKAALQDNAATFDALRKEIAGLTS